MSPAIPRKNSRASIPWHLHQQLPAALRRRALLGLALATGLSAGLLLAPDPSTGQLDADRTAPAPPTPSSTSTAPDQPVTVHKPVDRTSRSRAGAIAAAAQYATLLAQMWPMAPARARATAAEAAARQYRGQLVAAVNTELVPMQAEATGMGGTTTYRQSVLATHLDRYPTGTPGQPTAAERARVSVWSLLTIIQTGSDNAGIANATGAFLTSELDLVWERGAWRLSGSTDREGPTPLVEGTPSSGPQMTTQLKGFGDWRPE